MNKEVYLYNPDCCKNSDYNMWMAFPGIYSFSMSSLGYLLISKLMDEQDINVERISSDTIKTRFMVTEIDIIAFSFSFDLDFLQIFAMLDKYGIPLKAKERTDYPLIFAGGPVVTANPEPYKEFFDFFIIGDGEDVNTRAVQICKNNPDKEKALKLLSELEGVYVPKYSHTVKKMTKRLAKCVYTPILSEKAFFKNTFIIEITRGCANRCGFCLASYLNLPLRSVPFEEIIKALDLGLEYTENIALLGAELTAHPRFEDICKYIYDKIQNGRTINLSVSSLRADSVTPEIIKTIVAAGQKNSTLAIEAGSERLRRVINKNLNKEQIFNAVKIARENGLKGLKFYGMIGIPTETEQDLREMVSLAEKLKNENKGFEISFGFSSFVPKPHTPFQWCGRENSKNLEAKVNFLKKEMHKIGVQINVSSIKWDYWQAVLSRGDKKLNDFVLEVYKQGGKLGAFKAAAKKLNINPDYYAYENYSFDKNLPWDFIELSPGKDFLIKENQRLLS